MSTTTITEASAAPVQSLCMRVDGTDLKFGDFRDDLAHDGYAVVKGAIPREQALKYADDMYLWLEGL
jgi:hypothetical protein